MTDDLEWHDMDSFPQDGTRCMIEFKHSTRSSGWFWGRNLMGTDYGIRNDQNMMALWLEPLRWTKVPS
jgi:hypothetical protein